MTDLRLVSPSFDDQFSSGGEAIEFMMSVEV